MFTVYSTLLLSGYYLRPVMLESIVALFLFTAVQTNWSLVEHQPQTGIMHELRHRITFLKLITCPNLTSNPQAFQREVHLLLHPLHIVEHLLMLKKLVVECSKGCVALCVADIAMELIALLAFSNCLV